MTREKTSLHKSGFPPLVQADSRLLILGSMPGEKSLQEQQYYAHPRNLFWAFIAALSNNKIPVDYEAKKTLLIKSKIALWDVCDACIRTGSLDTAILNEIPNELDHLLDQYPDIKTIAFNGQKSAALFRKYFRKREGYTYITLPSTSPANAGIPIDKKREQWLSLDTALSGATHPRTNKNRK